jgi:hypothetical protein
MGVIALTGLGGTLRALPEAVLNRTATYLAATCLFLSACVAEIGDDADPELEQVEKLSYNKLSYNALTYNALSANFKAVGEMAHRPLATESYSDDSGTALAYQLHDSLTKEFFTYMVGCALEPGQVVYYKDTLAGGTVHKFKGDLGLCPAWGKDKPSQECLEVVSACLLARNNAFGIEVQLSMRGHDADGYRLPLALGELENFKWREGAFYGNVFDQKALHPAVNIYVDPTYVSPTGSKDRTVGRNFQVQGSIYGNMWACWSHVWEMPVAYHKDRICAGGGTNCAATAVGACQHHPTTGPTYQCKENDQHNDGDLDYQLCRDTGGATYWRNAITVFLDDPCAVVGKNRHSCGVYTRTRTLTRY